MENAGSESVKTLGRQRAKAERKALDKSGPCSVYNLCDLICNLESESLFGFTQQIFIVRFVRRDVFL